MRCWMFERWRCYWQGHRDLSPTSSYGGLLAEGRVRDLRFCAACDNYVWMERPRNSVELLPAWENLNV